MATLFPVGVQYNRFSIRMGAFPLLIILLLGIAPVPSLHAADPVHESITAPELQKVKIRAEVAANRPLRLIIRDASASGLGMRDILITLIRSGISPSTALYDSVAEGKDIYEALGTAFLFCCDCNKVRTDSPDDDKIHVLLFSSPVPCDDALNRSDCLRALMGSALTAGAGREAVLRAAHDAGCNSGEIAGAISIVETPGGPVHGHTSPAPEDLPAKYIPSTPVVIGGGGGGTRPASPYKPH